MCLVFATGVSIFLLTLFLDLLEMSFGRILWFMKTLRFWLYFILHFGISCLSAYLIHSKLTDWYLLAFVSTFLGVAIISNTNVKIAGISIVPVADLFVSIKTKMTAQAAEDKATVLMKAQLVGRLRRLSLAKLEEACYAALIAAGWQAERVQRKLEYIEETGKNKPDYQKNLLVDLLLAVNMDFVEQSIDKWEKNP